MEKLNITKGTWSCTTNPLETPNDDAASIWRDQKFENGETGSTLIAIISKSAGTKEAVNNAYFIAEAANVANETGLTPRELLKQRDELLEVIKDLLVLTDSYVDISKKHLTPSGKNMVSRAKGLINSITFQKHESAINNATK